ncbi:hypothetical protein KSP39_PZI011440 [Platanthera zijinensis]|uniref:Uncharacterized protein n=1 Tax=Platanthera zijinensis TaxID=2320716 RepID=A0AAP0BH09_9ASPA
MSTALPPPHSPRSPQPQLTMSEATPSGSAWKEYDMIKLQEAVAAYRVSRGIRPTSRKFILDFLEEVNDFIPSGLSENELRKKLYSEMNSFRKKPRPCPDCPDSDRHHYELELKACDLPTYFQNAEPNSSRSLELNQRANVTEKKQKASKKRKRV